MHLSKITVRNFRQFGEGASELQIDLQPGVTALVGRNDSGKSAVIDAIRYALLTRDQQFIRVEPEDFHIDDASQMANEISIACRVASCKLASFSRGQLESHPQNKGNPQDSLNDGHALGPHRANPDIS